MGIHTCQCANGGEVSREALAEDEGGGCVVGWRVGDSVCLTGPDTTTGVGVDLNSESSGDEGSAGSDHLEETHLDVVGRGLGW